MAYYGISGLKTKPKGPFVGDPKGYAIGKNLLNGNKSKPNSSHYSSYAPKSTGTTSNYSGYSDGGYVEPSYTESAYDRYLAQLEAEKQARLAKIKESIMHQMNIAVGNYDAQRPEIKQNYQNLRNQSEVERYNQARMLRESQANRGALDSGAGRQENLAMQNNFGNALNSINMAEQKDLNELNRAIEDIKSQAYMQMALAEADASADFSTALNTGYQNYGGETANYVNALSGIRKATRGGSSVTSSSGTGTSTGAGVIAKEIMRDNASHSSIRQALLNQLRKRKLNLDDVKKLGSGAMSYL